MNRNIYLLLLFIVLLAFPQMSETLITPALPTIAQSLAVSHRLLEFSVSLFFAGFALGVSFWGFAADWWGRLAAMRYGLAIFIAGSTACSLAQTLEQLYVATVIQAFGASCGSVVTQTMLRDLYTDKEERSKIFAIIGMSLAFSPALGPLLGNWLNLWLGWRADFAFLASLGVVMLFWSWRSLTETRPKELHQRSVRDLSRLAHAMLRNPFLLSCTALVGICNAVIFSFFAEGPYIFIEHLQLSPDEYGWIGIAVSLSIFVAGMLNHRLIARLGAENLIHIGSLVMTVGSALYLLASHVISLSGGTGLSSSLVLLTPLFLTFLGTGMMISNLLSIALRDYQHTVGSAGSIFGFGYYLVLSLLMAGMGILHGDSLLPLPYYLALLSIGAYVCACLLKRASKAGEGSSVLLPPLIEH